LNLGQLTKNNELPVRSKERKRLYDFMYIQNGIKSEKKYKLFKEASEFQRTYNLPKNDKGRFIKKSDSIHY